MVDMDYVCVGCVCACCAIKSRVCAWVHVCLCKQNKNFIIIHKQQSSRSCQAHHFQSTWGRLKQTNNADELFFLYLKPSVTKTWKWSFMHLLSLTCLCSCGNILPSLTCLYSHTNISCSFFHLYRLLHTSMNFIIIKYTRQMNILFFLNTNTYRILQKRPLRIYAGIIIVVIIIIIIIYDIYATGNYEKFYAAFLITWAIGAVCNNKMLKADERRWHEWSQRSVSASNWRREPGTMLLSIVINNKKLKKTPTFGILNDHTQTRAHSVQCEERYGHLYRMRALCK